MVARRVLPFVVVGCVAADEQAQTSEALAGQGTISVLGAGAWSRTLGCPSPDPATCVREERFWIDLDVRNDAYAKQVGVVWIDRVREDARGTWHVAPATYEGTRPDGRETW